MSGLKRCLNCGGPMLVELRGPVVGGKGAVTLWYCETCDYAEHEVSEA